MWVYAGMQPSASLCRALSQAQTVARSPSLLPTDSIKVLLSLDAATSAGATAAEGADIATVVFPALTAKTLNGATAEITCEGGFKGKTLTYKPGVTAAFPVGTTDVACIARTSEGESPAVKFTVTVCKPGVFFVDGACNGGLEARLG
jgi:hypothetical protein